MYRVLVGKPEGERDHLEEPGVYGRIILRWIFRQQSRMRGYRLGSSWLRIGTGGEYL
jgi:hypothetical protein